MIIIWVVYAYKRVTWKGVGHNVQLHTFTIYNLTTAVSIHTAYSVSHGPTVMVIGAQSASAEAEAQYQLKLSEAREAVNELVRHIHVSLIVATKSSNTSYIAQLCFHRLFKYERDSFNISEIVEGRVHGSMAPQYLTNLTLILSSTHEVWANMKLHSYYRKKFYHVLSIPSTFIRYQWRRSAPIWITFSAMAEEASCLSAKQAGI